MPNHCVNRLSVVGPDDQVTAFIRLSERPQPATGDPEGSFNNSGDIPKKVVFGFHGSVPLPAEYSEVPYSNHPGLGGYDMERSTWGVKWGPYDIDEAWTRDGEESEIAHITFTTAWSPPLIWMQKASINFPELKFYLSYGEESPSRGRAVVEAGNILEERHDDYSEFYDDSYHDEMSEEEEEALYEKNHEAEMHLVNTHDEWVGLEWFNEVV